jgi:hypothetical protein
MARVDMVLTDSLPRAASSQDARFHFSSDEK